MRTRREQFLEVMRVFSVLLNVLSGGHSAQTLCGRAYALRHTRKGWAVLNKMLDTIFFWDREHCRGSYVGDIRRAQYITRTYGQP